MYMNCDALVLRFAQGSDGAQSLEPKAQSLYPDTVPELPEVETIARGLAKRVSGDTIDSVWIGSKLQPNLLRRSQNTRT
jgi:formamidopyrimidine-DNA glycosylase-like protein